MSFMGPLVKKEELAGWKREREDVMIHSLRDSATVSLLSSKAHPTWNMQGQAVQQAAQDLSFLVYHSTREYGP